VSSLEKSGKAGLNQMPERTGGDGALSVDPRRLRRLHIGTRG
jgi:hypothetical protein